MVEKLVRAVMIALAEDFARLGHAAKPTNEIPAADWHAAISRALTTAQAQAAAQEQRIAALEGALEAMLNQRDRDIQAGRMQFSDPAPATSARAALGEQQ